MKEYLFSIKDKVIIITGGGGGIGKVIAHAMAQRQAVVYCLDIKFEKKIIEELTQNLFQVEGDITKISSKIHVFETEEAALDHFNAK